MLQVSEEVGLDYPGNDGTVVLQTSKYIFQVHVPNHYCINPLEPLLQSASAGRGWVNIRET